MPDYSSFIVTNHAPLDLAVMIVLLMASVPVLHRFLRNDRDARWMARLLWVSVVLHLFGAIAQNWVVIHIYNGSADYVGYDSQGAYIASHIKSGTFSLSSLHIPGNDMVGLTIGILYLVMSPDQLGGFLVFGWLAFLGLLGFYRAFTIVLPHAEHRRYALMIFLMPSLVYWPSASGKEAVMMAALGLSAYGAARLMTRQRGGWLVTAAGVTIGTLYRPHESLLLFAALCIAILLRRSSSSSQFASVRWIGTLVVLGGGLLVLSTVAASFLHVSSLSVSTVTNTLQKVNTNTVGAAHNGTAGFGSSVDYSWSPSLLDYPKDIYIVLFQPLPWQAHGFTQIVSALENVLIIGLFITSWRRLRQLPRAIFREPYLMFCVAFTAGFIYLFSSLGNLGLLSREKVLLMPLLFVPLALKPGSYPKKVRVPQRAPFEWATPAALVPAPLPG